MRRALPRREHMRDNPKRDQRAGLPMPLLFPDPASHSRAAPEVIRDRRQYLEGRQLVILDERFASSGLQCAAVIARKLLCDALNS